MLHRALCTQQDLTLATRNSSEIFYARGRCLSFHTAKTLSRLLVVNEPVYIAGGRRLFASRMAAHPAFRRTGCQGEGTATIAAAANATTTRIGAHLGRRELMLGFMESYTKVL